MTEATEAVGRVRRSLLRGGVFLGILMASCWLFPLAMGLTDRLISQAGISFRGSFVLESVVELLIVWPQLLLAPYGFMVGSGDATRYVLTGGTSMFLAISFWVGVGMLVGWALRRQRVVLTGVITVPLAGLILKVVHALLHAMGVFAYVEWP